MFVEQPLALLMMRKAEMWVAFLQNLYLYTYYQQCQRAWNDYMIREELAAVRKAQKSVDKQKKGGVQLSRHDIERIRRQRREEILQSDIQPPKVEGFEFFIVGISPQGRDDNTQGRDDNPQGRDDNTQGRDDNKAVMSSAVETSPALIAVGYYDPDKGEIEMAPWEEVAPLLRGGEASA